MHDARHEFDSGGDLPKLRSCWPGRKGDRVANWALSSPVPAGNETIHRSRIGMQGRSNANWHS